MAHAGYWTFPLTSRPRCRTLACGTDRLPDALRRRRRVMCSIPRPKSASITAFMSAAELGCNAASAALDAHALPLVGSSVSSTSRQGSDRARVACLKVEKACREKLAGALLVDRSLQHRWPHAVRHAAMHLAVQDERLIGWPPSSIEGYSADFDGAGVRIDRRPADAAPVG